MKKKLTLAMIIITIIEAVCMFIPGVIKVDAYHTDENQNIFFGFKGSGSGAAKFLSWVVILLLIALFASLVSAFLEKKNLLSRLSTRLPLASFISLLLLIFVCNRLEWVTGSGWTVEENSVHAGSLFYVVIILAAISTVLSFVVKSAKLDDAPAKKVPVGQTSKADEIKKYKDLLDSGIITQEEFEAKKSELLK